MSNLIAFPSDDDKSDINLANEASVDADGKGTVSIRGVARILGVTMQTLNVHFSPGSFSSSKLAKTLISRGFKPDSFSKFGVPDIAVAIITEYRIPRALDGGVSRKRGVARIVGVDESTLRGHFRGAGINTSKLAQMLIGQGFEPAGFFEKGIPDSAVSIVTSYYQG